MQTPIRIRYPEKLAGSLKTFPESPADCKYKIPFATTVFTTCDSGSFLSQSVSGNDYWMELCSFFVKTECYIDLIISSPFIALVMFMKGHLAGNTIGNGFVSATARCFDLLYLPTGIQRLSLQKGEYVLLYFLPPRYYLSSIAEEHPNINDLLEKFTSNHGAGTAIKSFSMPQRVWRIIKKLEKTNKKGPALDVDLRSYMLDILYLYTEQFKEQKKEERLYLNSQEKAQAVKKYILENLGDSRMGGLNELAGRFHISTKPLTREFKILTGKTIPRFITDRRLELAKQLIAKNEMRVFEVALLVGFSDSANFIRKFKKKFGYSPGKQIDYPDRSK